MTANISNAMANLEVDPAPPPVLNNTLGEILGHYQHLSCLAQHACLEFHAGISNGDAIQVRPFCTECFLYEEYADTRFQGYDHNTTITQLAAILDGENARYAAEGIAMRHEFPRALKNHLRSEYLRLRGVPPTIDWNASEKRQRQRLALTNPAILLGPAREAIAIERARFRFKHL